MSTIDTDNTNSVDIEKEIAEMHSRLGKKQHANAIRISFVTGLFREYDGEFDDLYSAESSNHYITVYKPERNPVTDSQEIDVAATNRKIKKVIKYARKRGFAVKKDYDDRNFTVVITLEDTNTGYSWNAITISYTANRETVCEKIVKYEDVPAQEATTREVIEWECSKVSFLGMDDDEE